MSGLLRDSVATSDEAPLHQVGEAPYSHTQGPTEKRRKPRSPLKVAHNLPIGHLLLRPYIGAPGLT